MILTFTVMKYKAKVKMTNLRYFAFEQQFDDIKTNINHAIKQLFIATS